MELYLFEVFTIPTNTSAVLLQKAPPSPTCPLLQTLFFTQRSKFSFLKEGPGLDTNFHLSSQHCGSITIRKKNKLKHFKAVNHRHSSDEETARQKKCFTKVSTAVLLPLLGEEKALLTSDAFKQVSLENMCR